MNVGFISCHRTGLRDGEAWRCSENKSSNRKFCEGVKVCLHELAGRMDGPDAGAPDPNLPLGNHRFPESEYLSISVTWTELL